MYGFQLVHSRANKMMEPRYRGITAKRSDGERCKGISVKVIAGDGRHVKGPVRDAFRSRSTST